MKEKDKRLLLIDLSGRLPYGVICNLYDIEDANKKFQLKELSNLTISAINSGCIKPYLRPMSSMTAEEKYTYRHMLGSDLNSEGESTMFVYVELFPTVIDWLNAHHFDFRGLIEEGLAFEAPEGMYKF